MDNELTIWDYFKSPLYLIEKDEWVDDVNTVCDSYILEQKLISKNNPNYLKEHEHSYQSSNLINESKLNDLKFYILKTSHNILDSQGYDLTNYNLYFEDMWVQEFSEKGKGHHNSHVHSESHISGFYFLKCSDKTSYPVFTDPRSAAVVTSLPQKNKSNITYSTRDFNYQPKPGTMIFFNSYLPHQFNVDDGLDPFRFIHFNIQAVREVKK
tara:strand:- start:2973 stop:3605 length:633 start_codon:yes stop_codon:yes gene_type:complete